jgi:hypothetical protein
MHLINVDDEGVADFAHDTAGDVAGVIEQLHLLAGGEAKHIAQVVRLPRIERDRPGGDVRAMNAAWHGRDYQPPRTQRQDFIEARGRGSYDGPQVVR